MYKKSRCPLPPLLVCDDDRAKQARTSEHCVALSAPAASVVVMVMPCAALFNSAEKSSAVNETVPRLAGKRKPGATHDDSNTMSCAFVPKFAVFHT